MKTKLKWRLGKLPTPSEVLELVKDKLITNEEAREILFNEETEEDIKVESLKEEIKFLRETIERLSDKKTISETIQVVIPKYITQPFYQPYYSWTYPNWSYCTTTGGSTNLMGYCSSNGSGGNSTFTSASSVDESNLNTMNCSNGAALTSTSDTAFSDISTF